MKSTLFTGWEKQCTVLREMKQIHSIKAHAVTTKMLSQGRYLRDGQIVAMRCGDPVKLMFCRSKGKKRTLEYVLCVGVLT